MDEVEKAILRRIREAQIREVEQRRAGRPERADPDRHEILRRIREAQIREVEERRKRRRAS